MVLIRCELGPCSELAPASLTFDGCMWKRKWLPTTVIKHVYLIRDFAAMALACNLLRLISESIGEGKRGREREREREKEKL